MEQQRLMQQQVNGVIRQQQTLMEVINLRSLLLMTWEEQQLRLLI